MVFDSVILSMKLRDRRLLCFFGLALAVLALLPQTSILGNWGTHIVILVMFYSTLAGAWNLLGGYTGQFSVGHAAFFGIAGYTMGILMAQKVSGPLLGAALGVCMSVLLALLVGFCTMRLRGIFFALTTMALAEILRKIALYQDNLTGGTLGLSLVIPGVSKTEYYYIALALMVAMFAALTFFERSRFGLYCIAIRENEDAALATGINTARVKLTATIISAFFTGLGGAFYAAYVGVIEPDVVFSTNLSIKIIILAIIGGTGSLIGPFLGALVVVIPEELIRGFLGGTYAGVSGIAYGLILVVTILLKPSGLRSLLAFAIPHKRD
ncbi:Putative branched-chain amino acid ABC transporter, permease protein (fragment) [uncultured delta proteobacterium]|uniref:Putative branched-chain amino acid ABC transporter, permease protein n=1 Tax=uncultured delta proteobacterium TaxID=34034 RepID=A0A212K4E3_9DELT